MATPSSSLFSILPTVAPFNCALRSRTTPLAESARVGKSVEDFPFAACSQLLKKSIAGFALKLIVGQKQNAIWLEQSFIVGQKFVVNLVTVKKNKIKACRQFSQNLFCNSIDNINSVPYSVVL